MTYRLVRFQLNDTEHGAQWFRPAEPVRFDYGPEWARSVRVVPGTNSPIRFSASFPTRLGWTMQAARNLMECVSVALALQDAQAEAVARMERVCRQHDSHSARRVQFSHVPELQRAIMSAAWSAEVRARVRALPAPGPRVYCQSEEDDD